MGEIGGALESGEVAEVVRDGAGKAVVGKVDTLERGEGGPQSGREGPSEVVVAQDEAPQPPALGQGGREGAGEGVPGEDQGLEGAGRAEEGGGEGSEKPVVP